MIDRRNLLLRSAALGGATLLMPTMALAAAATDKRLLFVLQRGAADGLATLAPVGDPDFLRRRDRLADGVEDLPKLDGFFALHPAFENIGGLYRDGQALFVHAVATSYRERSHFDAQNLLESGGTEAYAVRDGWLNRLLGLLPDGGARALALSPAVPLALQGQHSVSSYAPSALPEATGNMMDRVAQLYRSDPQLSGLLDEALRTREMAGDTQLKNLRDAEKTGELAASLMRGPEGARIMMVESDGWDSHAGQRFQFNQQATRLDAMLGAYRSGMGVDWNDTLVLVATEFGRTVARNGTDGTDHGTAGAAMLLGGSVAGGRVLADWPGLAAKDLYEERDLRPTRSLEAVLAGAVAAHFGIEPPLAMRTLFPDRDAQAEEGLLRSQSSIVRPQNGLRSS